MLGAKMMVYVIYKIRNYLSEKVSNLLFFFLEILKVFGKACSADKQILKMTASQKEYIVSMHNRMRNKIALGQIKNYSPAAKMPCFVRINLKIH